MNFKKNYNWIKNLRFLDIFPLGGPLQIYSHNISKCTYTQIGVVSFGARECGTRGIPGKIFLGLY